MKPLRIAVVGCGDICHQYGPHIKNHPELLALAGAFDLQGERAEGFCREYGGKAYRDFEVILDDPEVDVILNLTVHRAHYELNRRALLKGKHVYTEKPMAMTYGDAAELYETARKCGRLLGSAPITYMGEGMQTTAKFLETDLLGTLRLVYAEANWSQIERLVSTPAPYFTVGSLMDVGIYPITALTFLLGPVRLVWGYSTILKNPRYDKNGNEFPVTAPDFTTGMLEFENGVICRLTSCYYIPPVHQPHLKSFEFHGDQGSFAVSCYHNFNPRCRFFPYGKDPVEVPLLREAKVPMDRALGLAEMAMALREDRPLRNSPEHALHVIEIIEGLQTSADQRRPVEIRSNFAKPDLMDWTKDTKLIVPESL